MNIDGELDPSTRREVRSVLADEPLPRLTVDQAVERIVMALERLADAADRIADLLTARH